MGVTPASWLGVKHNVLDNTTWLPKTIVLCVAHNFHELSEFTSIFTPSLTFNSLELCNRKNLIVSALLSF